MKAKKGLFYCMVLLLTGCLPSLHPLYNDKTLIFKEELIGKWMGEDDGFWQFTRAGEKEYELRIREDDEELGRFSAHLIEIEGSIFLDLFPDSEQLEDLDDFYKIHLLPVHTFMKVDQIEPSLQLQMVDYEEIEEILEGAPNLLKHEIVDDRVVLTASTEELQSFLIKHVDSIFTDTSDDSSGAIRLKPLYTEQDIITDPNFVGQWKAEDGGVLRSKRTNEKIYELTYYGIDGTEREVYAQLIRHSNLLLMAVFADKAELNPDRKYSYEFHLIPDWFFTVDKSRSELILRKMDYEKVAEIFGKDTPASEYHPADTDIIFKGTHIEP